MASGMTYSLLDSDLQSASAVDAQSAAGKLEIVDTDNKQDARALANGSAVAFQPLSWCTNRRLG